MYSFDCVRGQCVDVSDGEPFAPCQNDEECFQEGDGCIDGKCEKLVDETPQCFEDHHCPQSGCLPDMICPKAVCLEGQCVMEESPPVICTADVKECPDGTYVSRSGPNCEFADCPPYFKCRVTSDCPEVSCGTGESCGTQYICHEKRGICMEIEASCCQDPEPSTVECGRSGCHCCGDGTWLLGNSGPTLTSAEACGERGPSKPCMEAEARCCRDPEPSTIECGRSGCHCCGDGTWILGNSGPTLTSAEACGELGPSKPCECRFDSDCPVLNCITEPCPSIACVDHECVTIEV